ncbi:MAG: hypothetical protein KF718_01735 [Polyangiaceae bacterium]|nr:hypothetical protein [Polyangiaceae bacterium]
MTEQDEKQEESSGEPSEEEFDGDVDAADEESVRDLLRGALKESDLELPRRDVLRGVQDKIRARSGGKFYDEGWSTAKHPPTMTYLWTSVIMIVIALGAYAVLASLSGQAAEVLNEPAPIQVVPAKPR